MEFEENLRKLEESVRLLESGNLSLKETLEKFEEGLKLSLLCNKELESVKQKIEMVVERDGKIVSETFLKEKSN